MEKRYQVFVSSTYVDLKDERQSVLQTLMEMDCIPAGMELFPAADEEQWEFIKRIIDDCDYYLLIIGGRYGSMADDGLSYTEKEFDYAVSKGIKVIALLHSTPDELPRSKTDMSEETRLKLQAFISKVKDGRLVRFWSNSAQLPGEVALSLTKTMKMFPAIGWVRANTAASPELLSEINELRKRNELLQKELQEQRELSLPTPIIPRSELENMKGKVNLNGVYHQHMHTNYNATVSNSWSASTTWNELFSIISPFLVEGPDEDEVSEFIAAEFSNVDPNLPGLSDLAVDRQTLFTIRIQLIALNLIVKISKESDFLWELTEQGHKEMMESRVIRSKILI